MGKNKKKVLTNFMSDMYKVKGRSEIWDFLYETEYACESMELNEAISRMTDAEVEEWFPKVCAEYICEEIGLS